MFICSSVHMRGFSQSEALGFQVKVWEGKVCEKVGRFNGGFGESREVSLDIPWIRLHKVDICPWIFCSRKGGRLGHSR